MSIRNYLVNRATAAQDVAIGTAAVSSAAIGLGTRMVRIVATAPAYIAFDGATAVTTGGSVYMPAGFPELFEVTAGSTISVIASAAGGIVNITELSR